MLKRKFDSGASEAITQFFFEADDFFRFRDACAKAGFNAPIVPGILPIENWENTKKFAARCGAKIPAWMDEIYRKATRDERSDLVSIALSTELCSQLIDGGVEALHFYILNRLELTRDILPLLVLYPLQSLKRLPKKFLIIIAAFFQKRAFHIIFKRRNR